MNSSTKTYEALPGEPQRRVQPCGRSRGEAGFTLIEVVVALIVITIALLGVVFTITYSINYNAGNSSRAKTLAVLQQEVERLRSAKFTPTEVDPALVGGETSRIVTSGSLSFRITTSIDNDPSTDELDDESEIINANTSFKEMTIEAKLDSPSPGWQTAVPAVVVLRRVKSN